MVTKAELAKQPEEVVVKAGREGTVVRPGGRIVAATAEELGLKFESSESLVEVPPDVQDLVNVWTDSYKGYLVDRTENYVRKLSALQAGRRNGVEPEAGEPTHVGYTYWDLITISPIQFIGLPPYEPNKIVASGELAFLQAVMFINPTTNIFNPISATTNLGGRNFRLRFEQINLTDVTNGPDFTFVGVFPAVAPSLIIFTVPFIAPNPGLNPRLVEVNVTADIMNPAQPYAAFSTWQLDVDSEPGFLGLPNTPPEFQHDIPMRYLIYPK
jgi:hypothetical protein